MDQTSLQDELDRLLIEHEVVGASVAVHDGTDVHAAAGGLTSLRTGVPITTSTIFQMGSITKVYTATLVMQLVDEGLLDLDIPVVTYLPELRLGDGPEAATLTARHLLTHTSGLFGDFFEDFGRGEESAARMATRFAELERIAEPGELVSYCNAGFVALGLLIEKLRGKPFSVVFREHLTVPMGAPDTVMLPEEVILQSVAIGHVGEPPQVAPTWSMSQALSAAGALPCASPSDLVAFARLHLNDGRAESGDQLLSVAAAKQMREPQANTPDIEPVGASSWGLGWMLFDWDGRTVIGHDGTTLGNNATLRWVPDSGVVVAITANGGPGVAKLFQELMAWALDDVAGLQVPPRRPAAEDWSSIDLTAFAGEFVSDGVAWRFAEANGSLVAELQPMTDEAALLTPHLENLIAAPIDDHTLLISIGDDTAPVTFFDRDERGRYARIHSSYRTINRSD